MPPTPLTPDQLRNAIDLNNINTLLGNAGQTPSEIQSYLRANQASFLSGLENDRINNGRLVFDGTKNALQTNLNTNYYHQRTKDVNSMVEYPMQRMRTDADGMIQDNRNAQRQYEINQWTSGNRADTLFVYQIIFVLVLALSILTGLWRMGVISTGLLSFAVFASLVVIVLVIVARAQYTAYQRNKRYWNKRQFPRLGMQIQSGSLNCPAASNLLDEFDYDKMKARVMSGTADVRGTTADYLKRLSGGVNSLAGQIA
jgi:hypothetical protein